MHRFDRDSEVYKMIQENKESRTAPRQSSTFKMLQEVLEADERGWKIIHQYLIVTIVKQILTHIFYYENKLSLLKDLPLIL